MAHLGPVPGGYAEQAVVGAEALLAVPEHVTLAEAVAAVGTGRTAAGIVELEPVGPDDVVLVPSAAGGLGWLLVQSALAAGARVVAAAGGPERVAALAPLRATLTVDYTDAAWADAVRQELDGVTVVLDGVGGAVGRAALELLRPGGRMVMFGWSAGAPTAVTTEDLVRLGVTAGWSLGPRMSALPGGIRGLAERALQRVADGVWQPKVSTYPLADAARAHAELEGRRVLGKAVLVAPADGAAMNSVETVGPLLQTGEQTGDRGPEGGRP